MTAQFDDSHIVIEHRFGESISARRLMEKVNSFGVLKNGMLFGPHHIAQRQTSIRTSGHVALALYLLEFYRQRPSFS